MKNIAVSIYGVFSIALIILSAISVNANSHLASLNPDFIASTFIPLTLFMIFLLALQYKVPFFSLLLLIQCAIPCVVLFLSLSNHDINQGYWLSVLHLVVLAIFVGWDLIKFGKPI